MSLQNLRLLKLDMERRQWTITIFPFRYKNHGYFVIVQLYLPHMPRPAYALVELTFVDSHDMHRVLSVPANSRALMCSAQELRSYFHIGWSENLGEILAQFTATLGRQTPSRVADHLPEAARRVLGWHSDPQDPGKIYCMGLRRNPVQADGSQGRRSPFNDQKTRVLRPELYARIGKDPVISFCYTDDSSKERSDQEIMADFIGR